MFWNTVSWMSSSARGIKRLTDRELCLSAESLTADLIVFCHKLLLRQNFSSPLPLYGRWWIIELQDRFIQTLNSWLKLCSRSVWISGSWPTGTHVKAGGLISHAAASIRRWSHFNHQPANEKSKVMYVFFSIRAVISCCFKPLRSPIWMGFVSRGEAGWL